MELMGVFTMSNLEEDIFGEKHEPKTLYCIAYKDDNGVTDEYRTHNFQEVFSFIKNLYHDENWRDIATDPRDNDFFQEYMRGNLVPQN